MLVYRAIRLIEGNGYCKDRKDRKDRKGFLVRQTAEVGGEYDVSIPFSVN
jgi:hypothetical protein